MFLKSKKNDTRYNSINSKNCRGKTIDIENDILKYFPFIENILKHKDNFITKFENNDLKLNLDPVIMTELVNFYLMPRYRIPDKHIMNVKKLAKYMGHEILTTKVSDEKNIDNVYKINDITFNKILDYTFTSSNVGQSYDTIYKKITVDVDKQKRILIFEGHPNSNNCGYQSDTYGGKKYCVDIFFRISDRSLKILNESLFFSNLNNNSNEILGIDYEEKFRV